MDGLKKRFASQGITLEQFAFQFIVILLGVYLAILFEGKAEDWSRETEAEAMLETVLNELTLDEAEMVSVLETQRQLARGYETVADLLATASPADEAAIDAILTEPFSPTVFPRRSAYTGLLASGNLGYVSDGDLSLLLVDLYEHYYVRLANMGRLLDDAAAEWFPILAESWDQGSGRLIHPGATANAGFRNFALQRSRWAGYYVTRAEETVEQLRIVKGRLKEHLGQ